MVAQADVLPVRLPRGLQSRPIDDGLRGIVQDGYGDDPMERDSVISKSPDVLEAALADDTCIFDAESGKYWTFTRTSARAWDLLAQPRSLRALVTALAEEFDAPRSAVERDVEAFVAFLMERRLVRLSRPVPE